MHIWPALIVGYENTDIVTTASETRAKVTGLLKSLKSMSQLFKVCVSLDLLEKVGPSSMVFEGDGLMPFEVKNSLKMTLDELDDVISSCEEGEPPIDSYLRFFDIETDEETGKTSISRDYTKAGQELRNPLNREFEKVMVEKLNCVPQCHKPVLEYMTRAAKGLKKAIKKRFKSFDDEVYQSFKFFDPKYWDLEDKNYGIDQIECLYNYFGVPLDKSGFDVNAAKREWKSFKKVVADLYPGRGSKDLWKQVFMYRKPEFPQLCLLASLIMAISGSNSSVERSFSVLTLILSDRRLKSSHDMIDDLMVIKGNNKNWSEKERQEIIDKALAIYLSKSRKRKIDEVSKSIVELSSSSSEEEETESESDGEMGCSDEDIV